MKKNNILDYLDNVAQTHPHKPAFIGENSALTFSKLKEKSEIIASFIADKAIYNEPVLVFMEKSPEEAAAFLGIIRSGNYHVALDIEMAENRLSHIINITKSKIMICDKHTESRAKELNFEGEIYNYEAVINIFTDNFKNDFSQEQNLTCGAGRKINYDKLLTIRKKAIDTDPIYIVFTSGSTGVPKGVIANHRSVIDYIEELGKVLECSENTVFGNQAPLYLDACLKDFYTTMKYGATTYFIPKKLFMMPVKLIEYLNENKINTICFVVSALTILTKLSAFDYAKPEYLRVIAFGGEVFPLNHFKKWKETCKNAKFINLYGPTECTGMSSFYVVKDVESIENGMPIGRAFPNTDIFLLDENDKMAETGTKGEICIRGTGLTLGYYRDFKRTDENFVQNPLNKNYPELIYRTGDIGYFDENGELYFAGRKDNQIKHMGHRIELEEIEACGNFCKGVVRGICIYDKENSIIKFIYEGNAGEAEVKEYFRKKLAGYMVPGRIVQSDKLPVMAGGKIDRKRLADV